MIFFYNLDGTPIHVSPTQVAQNSGASKIYFAIPRNNHNLSVFVHVAFELPNGETLPLKVMKPMTLDSSNGLIGVQDEDKNKFYLWSLDLTSDITMYSGKVTCQFIVSGGGEHLATMSNTIDIMPGVAIIEPKVPETYEELVDVLGIISQGKQNQLVAGDNVKLEDNENGTTTITFIGGGEGPGGTNYDVDAELSETSTNPVQNKVVTEKLKELNGKIKEGADDNIIVYQLLEDKVDWGDEYIKTVPRIYGYQVQEILDLKKQNNDKTIYLKWKNPITELEYLYEVSSFYYAGDSRIYFLFTDAKTYGAAMLSYWVGGTEGEPNGVEFLNRQTFAYIAEYTYNSDIGPVPSIDENGRYKIRNVLDITIQRNVVIKWKKIVGDKTYYVALQVLSCDENCFELLYAAPNNKTYLLRYNFASYDGPEYIQEITKTYSHNIVLCSGGNRVYLTIINNSAEPMSKKDIIEYISGLSHNYGIGATGKVNDEVVYSVSGLDGDFLYTNDGYEITEYSIIDEVR